MPCLYSQSTLSPSSHSQKHKKLIYFAVLTKNTSKKRHSQNGESGSCNLEVPRYEEDGVGKGKWQTIVPRSSRAALLFEICVGKNRGKFQLEFSFRMSARECAVVLNAIGVHCTVHVQLYSQLQKKMCAHHNVHYVAIYVRNYVCSNLSTKCRQNSPSVLFTLNFLHFCRMCLELSPQSNAT